MYVSMDVCVYVRVYAYVCEFVCSMARRTRRRDETVRWRHGGMDGWNLWGEGGRHLRFNLAVSFWKEGAPVVSLRTERSLGVSRLPSIWQLPKTGRLSDRRREGTCLRAMQVTDALQPRTPTVLQKPGWTKTFVEKIPTAGMWYLHGSD